MGIKNIIDKVKNNNAPKVANVMLYTEQTPNPETLKFVSNKMLFNGIADLKTLELAQEWSEFATELYSLPYIKGVYISNNFVTILKEMNYSWQDIMLPAKEEIKRLISEDIEVVKDGYMEAMLEKSSKGHSDEDSEIVGKIKNLIDTYVKPAVESDGGNIEFAEFENGTVTVNMQGSCSGCPSATVTLKAGIESMLKRMIPEVHSVVARED